MLALLDIGRYALEGVEVLTAFATTGLLAIGLYHAHRAQAPHPLRTKDRND